MNILLYIVSYFVAFWIIVLTGWIAFLFSPRLVVLEYKKLMIPTQEFVIEALSSYLGVYLVVLMEHLTPLRASVAMILIPALMHFFNDRIRIAKAVRGESGALAILRNRGEEHLYDQQLDVWKEYGEYYGKLTGFATGIFHFLGEGPFF